MRERVSPSSRRQACHAHAPGNVIGLCDVRGAAAALGLSAFTVRKWVRERRIPIVRLGRAIRFDPRALERFIERNTLEEREAQR